ncbi:MAG: hypothetical protein R2727_08150 [Bacteroidales bacterium]
MNMKLPQGTRKMVILGRPYNTSDPHLNLNLVDKLIGLGTLPIPVDFVDSSAINVFDDYYMMYWPNGQVKILSLARMVLEICYLSLYTRKFPAATDSFITHFVCKEMSGKPFLHLEVDEHSADAGMITRCEAFWTALSGF